MIPDDLLKARSKADRAEYSSNVDTEMERPKKRPNRYEDENSSSEGCHFLY